MKRFFTVEQGFYIATVDVAIAGTFPYSGSLWPWSDPMWCLEENSLQHACDTGTRVSLQGHTRTNKQVLDDSGPVQEVGDNYCSPDKTNRPSWLETGP